MIKLTDRQKQDLGLALALLKQYNKSRHYDIDVTLDFSHLLKKLDVEREYEKAMSEITRENK